MSDNPLSGFLRGLDRVGRGYAEINRRLSSWLEQLEPAAKRLAELARQFGDGLLVWSLVSSITFNRGGWSEVPLKNMPLSEFVPLLDQLKDKPDEEVSAALDVAIPEYFRRDEHAALSDLVASWTPRFEARAHILEDALRAHKCGYYTLSIPTLAAQFEGIIRSHLPDGPDKREWKEEFLKTLSYDREKPVMKVEKLSGLMELPASERFRRAEEERRHFTLKRIDELFKFRSFSEPGVASVVNRHVILHGVFQTFGEKESLKLFFVLDLLHEAIGMYDERAQHSISWGGG